MRPSLLLFAACVVLTLLLEFLLFAFALAWPGPLEQLTGSPASGAAPEPLAWLRDGAILARLYFFGFRYLAIVLFVLAIGWIFWIRSGWRYGLTKAAVFAVHAGVVLASFRLLHFPSAWVFLAVMLAFNLLVSRLLWEAIVDRPWTGRRPGPAQPP